MKSAYGEHVRVESRGHVAILTMDRPPVNFVSVDLVSCLAEALDDADADTEVRAIVLQAEGKSFCAGADLASPGENLGHDPDGLPALYREAIRIYDNRKPIVAAVQGAAVGAGLGLALAADFRVVSPEARFVANFTRLAFHPGFGISYALPRLIGEQKAALMLLTGRRVKGEQAAEWGLADECVASENLRSAALDLATEIAEGAPLALIATRQTLRRDLAAAIRQRTIAEYGEQRRLQATEDFGEGVRSVAERRPGRFTGR